MCYVDHEKVPEGAAFITVCFAGDAKAAEEAVRPLRESLPVLSDGLGLRSYLQIQVMQGDVPFGLRHYWKGHFVDSLPDDLIDEIVDHYLAHPQDGCDVVLIEQMHGAALRVPPDATAFSRREKCFNVTATAVWEDTAGDATTSPGRGARPSRSRSARGAAAATSTTELRMSPSNACARPTEMRSSSGCGS